MAVTLLTLDTRERPSTDEPAARRPLTMFLAFSPDGKRLAFVRRTSAVDNGRLHIMTLPDGEPRAFELPNSFLFTTSRVDRRFDGSPRDGRRRRR